MLLTATELKNIDATKVEQVAEKMLPESKGILPNSVDAGNVYFLCNTIGTGKEDDEYRPEILKDAEGAEFAGQQDKDGRWIVNIGPNRYEDGKKIGTTDFTALKAKYDWWDKDKKETSISLETK